MSRKPKGLLTAREAVSGYYAAHGSQVSPDDLILTTSTSEAYSFLFRLLCDPGDTVLVPTPSYPLFDFLADLQDVKLEPYELVYDHGWQIDFHSVQTAMERASSTASRCRAVLVVHPNNPTGSFVKPLEAEELNRICATNEMAIIADEVFLDYSLAKDPPLTFSSNNDSADLHAKWAVENFRPAADENRMDCGERTAAAVADAMSRLEVIADTYLSMNAPLQWAVPVMLEERHEHTAPVDGTHG